MSRCSMCGCKVPFPEKIWEFAEVGTSENPDDMLTKFFGAESLGRLSKNVGYEFPVDNFQVLKARDNLAAFSELEVLFKNFAKHLGIARAQERWIRRSTANSQCSPVLCVRTE